MSRTRDELVSRVLVRLGVTGTDTVTNTKVRADLVNRILSRLSKLQAGETLADGDEDYDLVDDNIVSILDGLKQREIYTVADITAIDSAAFQSLSTVCAWEFADDYGIAGEQRKDLERATIRAEAELRRINVARFTTLVDDELTSIAEELAQREVYSVGDLDTIDDGAFQALSAVVAWEFVSQPWVQGDKKVIQADKLRGELTLRRINASDALDAPVKSLYY